MMKFPLPNLERLTCGLTLGVLPLPGSSLVATALCYPAGAAGDPKGGEGLAHFLEHMMFKGSGGYAEGEVDRLTQVLGGSNNAFTTHDAVVYHFSFSGDRWLEAVKMETDRMAGLTLAPAAVEAERSVIQEEISQAANDPWDALEREVMAALYGDHPYGRPILGTRRSLERITGEDLADHHHRFHSPAGAVLIIAGDVGATAASRVKEVFSELPARPAANAAESPGALRRAGSRRIERRRGETPRLLLAFPGPPSTHPDYAPLRLALTLLGLGRSSRLQRLLVDEEQLCSAIWVSLTETLGPSAALFALELVPGAEPAGTEARLQQEIARVGAGRVTDEELDRAKRMLLADWVFGHQRVHQRAVSLALAAALTDLGHPERHLEAIQAAGADDVVAAARRYLSGDGGSATGWSLPEPGRARRVE